MPVLTIALNTFREAVRDKIFYVLLVFGVLMICASRIVGMLAFGTQAKIMTDEGLFAIWLFSGMISIFVGTGLIYKEIEKRTIYTILARPTERWQFLLGKYLGLLLITLLNIATLSLVLGVFLKFHGVPLTPALAQALALIAVEMMVITAVAIFFSSASTPILSAVFTTLIFFAGQLTQWVLELAEATHQLATGAAPELPHSAASPLLTKICYTVYLLLPNLHNFNIRQEAVLATQEGLNMAVPPAEFYACIVYGVSYALAVLLAAHLVFNRRNF